MTKRIQKWFLANTTPEFREDIKAYYKLDTDYFVDYIKRSGAEFILNKNLDFHVGYHGSQSNPNLGVISHIISVELRQDKQPIHQEILTLEVPDNQ